VVCHAIGLETGHACQNYIQLYKGDAALLMESLENIRSAASRILDAICEPAETAEVSDSDSRGTTREGHPDLSEDGAILLPHLHWTLPNDRLALSRRGSYFSASFGPALSSEIGRKNTAVTRPTTSASSG
jgi:hypothetical protein